MLESLSGKRAHTQPVRERSSTVVVTRWATVDSALLQHLPSQFIQFHFTQSSSIVEWHVTWTVHQTFTRDVLFVMSTVLLFVNYVSHTVKTCIRREKTVGAERRRILWRNVSVVGKSDRYCLFYWPVDITWWTTIVRKIYCPVCCLILTTRLTSREIIFFFKSSEIVPTARV